MPRSLACWRSLFRGKAVPSEGGNVVVRYRLNLPEGRDVTIRISMCVTVCFAQVITHGSWFTVVHTPCAVCAVDGTYSRVMSQKMGDISSGDLTEWLSARGLSSETCDALACAGLGGATLLELCEDDLADEELGLEPDEIAKLLELIVAAQQARDDDDEDGDGGDADGEASALAIGGSFGTLLSVGLVCFDITMIIAELPHADSKMRAQRSVHGAGGNAANTCVACCRLAPAGLAPHKKVRLLTRLGDDALAAQVCWCVLVCVCVCACGVVVESGSRLARV